MMNNAAIPSVYPAEGTFEFTPIHVFLSCITPKAVIHYTTDGTTPTDKSPVFNPDDGLLCLDVRPSGRENIVIRAFASAEGYSSSNIVTYTYHFCCRQKGTYRHQILREPSASVSGIIRIEDYALDKMYLVIGQKRAVLIDCGWDEDGNLPDLCRQLIGDLPLDLIVAHGHPDHVMQAQHFLEAGCQVYLPSADTKLALKFLPSLNADAISDISEGDSFDLGGSILKVYSIPGHTPGGIVLVDEESGDLFSSDEFGSNRRYVCDSAFLQLTDISLEAYLHTLDSFIEKTRGKLIRLMSGHNDEIIDADSYLAVLRKGLSRVVAEGESSLVPSKRASIETGGSGTAFYEGDYRTDPIWVSGNVKYIYDKDVINGHYVRGFNPNQPLI